MATCDVCGNEYSRSITVEYEGATHTFDSFECAIHMLAPACEHCGCRIVVHGHEDGTRVFCCAHCARAAGVEGLADST